MKISAAKRIHMAGIGGVGMAALAVLLKNRGHRVDGCDLHLGRRTEWLAAQGIPVAGGHSAAHIAGHDLVIFTPAVDPDGEEFRAAAAAAVAVKSRGETLAEIVSAAPDAIAVCGSHGKTTTSTFIARLLLALGERVEWAIGGETGEFPVAGRAGGAADAADAPAVLVVEADESDGTLALYHASTLVVTNCEYDHPDHFPTVEAYRACYDRARANAGAVVEASALTPPPFLAALPAFAALAPHNRANAAAAVVVALGRGHSAAAIAAALPAAVAALPDRRFQLLADGVYTDYAHHPTEMRCAVAMARQKCRGKLRVLFQPHRYSRTRALIDAFADAFPGADEVVLCPTYAAFERPVAGGGIADLYAALRRAFTAADSPRLLLARSCGEAWEHAVNSRAEGDLTLLLGAGDIIALERRIRENPAPARRREWLGAGTNTWRSDLQLAVDYVKSESPAGRAGAELLADPAVAPLIPFMAGIPGTLGGWLKMNAGAFGHAIGEAVAAVKVDGRWLAAAECGFGYRTSALSGEIQDVRWRSEPPAGLASAAEYRARRKVFPAHTRGSVFKNPADDFAGRLLEAAGCKGLVVGGARVWDGHANVIIDEGTASDFLALAMMMRERVRLSFGVELAPEVIGLPEGGLT